MWGVCQNVWLLRGAASPIRWMKGGVGTEIEESELKVTCIIEVDAWPVLEHCMSNRSCLPS